MARRRIVRKPPRPDFNENEKLPQFLTREKAERVAASLANSSLKARPVPKSKEIGTYPKEQLKEISLRMQEGELKEMDLAALESMKKEFGRDSLVISNYPANIQRYITED